VPRREGRRRTRPAAFATNERIGARPWLAHTRRDLGRILLAQGDPGDAERARLLLEEAIATYRELGMAGHAVSAAATRT
jgi:hypothetical protein